MHSILTYDILTPPIHVIISGFAFSICGHIVEKLNGENHVRYVLRAALMRMKKLKPNK